MKSILIALTTLLLISCQSEEIAEQPYNSVEDLILDIQKTAEQENNIISFEIKRDGSNFSTVNLKKMDNFVSEFEDAFNNPNSNRMPGGVTVTCVYGGTTPDNVTNCPPGPGQGNCVGSATIQCLSGGGCATSCAQRTVITVIPTTFKPNISKK
ncbi:MAG: hypothetical protein H0X63_13190 [Flavobacteriales bacterium]|nr:hypothetical protein [Flavobacteriales bacterium]